MRSRRATRTNRRRGLGVRAVSATDVKPSLERLQIPRITGVILRRILGRKRNAVIHERRGKVTSLLRIVLLAAERGDRLGLTLGRSRTTRSPALAITLSVRRRGRKHIGHPVAPDMRMLYNRRIFRHFVLRESQLGMRVKYLRKTKRISQEELAFISGVNKNYISDLERGVRNPTLRVLEKLANALDVSLSDLLKGIETIR